MVYHRKKIVILCFTLIFILISCSSNGIIGEGSIGEDSKWIREWLKDPECYPPCYKSIVPGESSIDEIEERFENMPGITELEIDYPEDNQFTKIGRIIWRYKNSNEYGIIKTYENSLKVSQIKLTVTGNILLSDLLSYFDEPTHVWIMDCRSEILFSKCQVNLVYIKKGLILGLSYQRAHRNKEVIKIRSNAFLDNVVFFPPGIEGFCHTVSDCKTLLAPWEGYGSYSTEEIFSY